MQAIPDLHDPDLYENTSFNREAFVEVQPNQQIDVKMQYPLLGMKNAEKTCYLRKGVYERLIQAANQLPKGYRIRILDAWRPFALQEELYQTYSEKIIQDFKLKNCSSEYRKAFIKRFVSEPVANKMIPPVHTTGGAVDVTIIDDKGIELNMGTGFDAFSDLTDTAAFENEMNEEICNNRRMLYYSMISAGFTNLPSEWWHYDYGDRFWAYYNQKDAMYEGVFTRKDLYEEK